MRNPKLVVILEVVLSIGMLVGCANQTSSSNHQTEPYVLGVFEPLTGSANVLGTPVKNAAEMAVDYINKNGGVNGHQIKLEIIDATSTPDEAVRRLPKLINAGVYGIIGPNLGSQTLAISGPIQDAKVPIMAFNNTISITEKGNPYIFRAQTNDATNVEASILFVQQEFNAKKIAVLYSDDAYGSDAFNALEKLIKQGKYDVKIVATEEYSYSATNVSAQWSKIRASNPDAVILWGSGTGVAVALKNAGQLGINVPIVGGQGLASGEIAQAVSDSSKVYAIGLIDPTSITPEQKDLNKMLQEKYGSDHQISTFDVIGWDAVHVYAHALEISQGDKSKFLKTLNSTKDLKLAGGIYNFSEENHDGLGLKSVVVLQVKAGKFVGVKSGL